MIMFWATLLAVSILLYVLLDGFDLGVGILFGLTGSETRRSAMLAAVAPIWDGDLARGDCSYSVAPFQLLMRVSYRPFIFHSLSCWRG
jgi:Cytochrome bd terminal oxidase subunit II